MDWTEIVKHISVVIAAWVAIYGIDSWRREHSGKRRLELAEDTLSLFYEASDVIDHIRSPMSFSSETADIERNPRETDAEFNARKNASVVFKRYNDHQELFNKLHAMRYRFMAQIGKEQAKPFDDLRGIVKEIIGAARVLMRLWPHDHFRTDEERNRHLNNIEKYEAIFWSSVEEEDSIRQKLNIATSEIESTCQAVIAGKGTLHGILNWRVWRST